jgi:hypothetical protein
MSDIETKQCSVCKKTKPVTEFWSQRLGRYVKMCAHCRYISNRSKRKDYQPTRKRPGHTREVLNLTGEPISDHELLGLMPATMQALPARHRPGDVPGEWVMLR